MISKNLIIALEAGSVAASVTSTLCKVMSEKTPVYVPAVAGTATFLIALLVQRYF